MADIGTITGFFISVWLKFFFLLTPFFALTVFLAMTKDYNPARRKKTAIKTTLAVEITCLFLFFFGNFAFKIFGITLDSFRIGAGCLLFLTAINLIKDSGTTVENHGEKEISVVPMAIPFIVGPGTTGALLVMGADLTPVMQVTGCAALTLAIACIGVMLFMSSGIHKVIGRQGLEVLSKVSGLVIASLAAQIVFTGIKNFLNIQ
ncbi:MAG: hypothetical protein A2020_08915 [Lentisphaerae bacterium GWF2_45_14]|nr:MAG: hypothetical protein A2020_08915 [Lentisphaerae bacterium GWF2_45_14]